MSITVEEFLDLPEGLAVESTEIVEKPFLHRVIYCKPTATSNPVCKWCGLETHVKDNYLREAWDLESNGKPTKLCIKGKRYACQNPSCSLHNESFILQYGITGKHDKITLRLKEKIANESFYDQSFENVGRRYGLSADTVRNIFLDKVAAFDSVVQYEDATVIGIDEVHLWSDNKRAEKDYYLVMVDESDWKTKLIDILPTKTKKCVIAGLERFANPDKIVAVTMDMTPGFRSAVEEVLGTYGTKVIVDRWHVIKGVCGTLLTIVNDLLLKRNAELEKLIMTSDPVPKSLLKEKEDIGILRKKLNREHLPFKSLYNLSDEDNTYLNAMLLEFPFLESAFKIYQDLASIYQYYDRNAAAEVLNDWIKMSTAIVKENPEFIDLQPNINSIRNWKNEILNFFDFPDLCHRTNGPTEAWNNEIERVNNYGRGYSFDVLRGKLIYGKAQVYITEEGALVPKSGSFRNAFNVVYKNFSSFYVNDLADDFQALLIQTVRRYPAMKVCISDVFRERDFYNSPIPEGYANELACMYPDELTETAADLDRRAQLMVRGIPEDEIPSRLLMLNLLADEETLSALLH